MSNKYPSDFHIVPEYISPEPAIDSFSSSYERKESQIERINLLKQSKEPFKSSHSFSSCLQGYFEYIEKVALEDFEVEYEYEKKKYVYKAVKPTKIVISNNLFRAYSCLDLGCSKCCVGHGFVNIFSEQEYSKFLDITKAQDDYNHSTIKVKGEDRGIRYYVHTHEVCKHIDTKVNGCGVHQYNPIHCAFPLMKFKRVKGVTHITREYFGRNWNMKCPAKFKPVSQAGFDYTLFLLNRVLDVAKEFNIKTDLERIIPEVTLKYHALLNETTIF